MAAFISRGPTRTISTGAWKQRHARRTVSPERSMRINFGFAIADFGLRTADFESFIAQSRNRIGCLPIRNPQSEIRNRKSAIRNPKSAIGLLALAVSLA